MSVSVNNYGGRQPSNTQNVKQFYTSSESQLWTYKKVSQNGNGTSNLRIVPITYTDVLIQKDLIVEGSILNPSDITLKKNMNELTNSEILNLNPIEFNFKSDELEKKHYGFIAQDMEKIFPELVSNNTMGYKTVNYIELIPIMLSKMKEMQNEIDSIKKTLSENR
jgi:hypothetical protein